MNRHATDEGVFIRSLATRGHQGGLSRATSASVAVLDAAGFSVIFVETVGAGQAELDVADAADAVVVVTAPGLGDEVQALKAGLLEIADLLVVNKGDRDGADRTLADLGAMLSLGARAVPPLLKTVAAPRGGDRRAGRSAGAPAGPSGRRTGRAPPPSGRATDRGDRGRARPRAGGGGARRDAGRDRHRRCFAAWAYSRRCGVAHARSLERRRPAPGGVKIPAMKPLSLKATTSAIAALGLVGCGLISSDITKMTFDLPTETYTFDTAQWNIPPALQGAAFPSIACTTDSDCCTLGSAAGLDCTMTTLTCQSGSCAAELPESQATVDQPVDRRHAEPLLSTPRWSASRSAESRTPSGATA